jgi:Cu(I)/Ag(I) efflux system membrane fusion protein/cobalt-zinc-cadmium efflux system membrane fusion protein
MTEDKAARKTSSRFRVSAITAVLTVLITVGVAYLLGYFDPRHRQGIQDKTEKAGDRGRKILYWRAPMNPTEIYDKPGKSAMGMDLVPVYEDELAGSKSQEKKSKRGRKVAYWRAPMNPTEIYDKPGKSAMGMDLVPVYEDELVGGIDIKIDPVVRQNMGVRTAKVGKGPLNHTIRAYGHITYDETRTAEISPKISGWIDKLHIDFTGKFVRKGDPLFELYSPELFAAQEEYLVTFRNLDRMTSTANKNLLESARQRLRYFDIAESEILDIERSGKISKNIAIRSPFDGVVTVKNAVEGSYVKAGMMVYRVADLSRVWVEAHIFEYELSRVSEGQSAVMTLPYLPGRSFFGKVSYVYPYLQRKTRDVVVRLEYKNPDLALKPDMYADIEIKHTGGEGIIIPTEAVIRSGERNIVFVVRRDDEFSPRDVTLGISLDGQKVEVLSGLAPGETVVTSGQFLLDSESKLNEAVQKMMEVKESKLKEKEPEAEQKGAAEDMEKKDEDFFKDLEEPSKEPEEDFFKDLEKGS